MTHADCCPGLVYPHAGSMRSDAVIVVLGPEQMAEVDDEHRTRQAAAAKRGGRHRFGFAERDAAPEIDRKQRAAIAAELAVARWLRLEWTGTGSEFGKPDVGGRFEVRHSLQYGRSLIMHRGDRGEAIYVDGVPPAVILRGWMDASEAINERYYRPDIPHPAYLVPQDALHDLGRLRP